MYTSTPFACVRSLCLYPGIYQHICPHSSVIGPDAIIWFGSYAASSAPRPGVSPCLVVWHGYRRQEACGCFIDRFLRGVPFLFGLIGTSKSVLVTATFGQSQMGQGAVISGQHLLGIQLYDKCRVGALLVLCKLCISSRAKYAHSHSTAN